MAGLGRCGKSRLPLGFDPRTVQPVAEGNEYSLYVFLHIFSLKTTHVVRYMLL